MLNPLFWKNRRVLITGHTGFKGGWLRLWLGTLGARVSGLSLAPATKPNLFELANVSDGLEHNKIIDLRDQKDVHNTLNIIEPEIIFHLAAQPLVRQSYHDPIETYETNIMGLVHLYEAIRQTPSIKTMINITTDKCYENKEWDWGYRENDPLGGRDPYSSSKSCAEIISQAYRASFFNDSSISLATARAGNVLGGGDWAEDRLVPDILSAIAEGSQPRIRYPQATRPWQHVLDPLSGYLLLAERLHEDASLSGAWNFGPYDKDNLNVAQITELLLELYDSNLGWASDQADQPHEAHFLKLDCSKAANQLDWHPRWSCRQALSAVVSWHKNYLAGENPAKLCRNQITLFNQNSEESI